MSPDTNLVSVEPEFLGQPDSLGSAGPEYFRGFHAFPERLVRYIIKIYHVPMCGKLLDSEFALVGALVNFERAAEPSVHETSGINMQLLVTIDARPVLLG